MISFLRKLISLTILSFGYSQICQLIVPQFPLSYNGLITPYQLAPPCDMKIAPSFVEAVILDTDTNSLFVYHPLVINQGSIPLTPPVAFNMPKNSIVGIWFGSNANAISLTPLTSIQQGLCVFNTGGINSQDTFGQFAHCNGIAFFDKIKELITNNIPLNPPVPDLGIAIDGEPCLTTRDFSLVDMDPSDNVVTTYLIDMATGRTSQNNFNNQNLNPQAVILKNGSDNLLLSNLDNIMGCKPYQVPNLVDLNNPITGKISSMALDEIHASLKQKNFYAYISKGDPMTRINNMPSLSKLNAYRKGIFQPIINDIALADTTAFCAHYTNIQLPRLQKNKQNFIVQPSPDTAISNNLYGFLLNRFSTSYIGLNCHILLDIPNPINLIMNNNIVTDGTISLMPQIEINLKIDPYLLSWDEYPDFIPTPEPTTLVPTTLVPTTLVPTTLVPTTLVPTTLVPTTLVPTTLAPTTLVPTTLAPTTLVPTTLVPTTLAPTTLAPTTLVPTTLVPTNPKLTSTPVPTTASQYQSAISTNLILLLSLGGIITFICVYYSLKNCTYCKREDKVNNVNYIDLESNVIESKGNKDKITKNIKLRNLSPVRLSKN